jgi:uncharacterized protein YdaU (DUF1376 family)
VFIGSNFLIFSIWVQKTRILKADKNTRRVAAAIFQRADKVKGTLHLFFT